MTQHSHVSSGLVAGILAGFSLSVLVAEAPQAGFSTVGAALAGFLLYALIDRFVNPVCAFCQAQEGSSRWPLVVMSLALALHSLMDGALLAAHEGLRWAVVVHKIPELFAVFLLLRSMVSQREAWVAFLFVQGMTLVGYAVAHRIPFAAEATLAATGALGYLALHGLHETYEHAPQQLWLSAAAASTVVLLTH